MSAPTVRRVCTDREVLDCYEVMVQLRPHLHPPDLLAGVRRMEGQGYRLVVVEADFQVCALAGYRVVEMLRSGRALLVDDFVTDAASRSRGYGRLLHDWLVVEAIENGCSTVELDSAVHRSEAHRFYFRQRMSVLAFHFSLPVSDGPRAADVPR